MRRRPPQALLEHEVAEFSDFLGCDAYGEEVGFNVVTEITAAEGEDVGEITFRIMHLFQILVHVRIGYKDGIGRDFRLLLPGILVVFLLLVSSLLLYSFIHGELLRRIRLPYPVGLPQAKRKGTRMSNVASLVFILEGYASNT